MPTTDRSVLSEPCLDQTISTDPERQRHRGSRAGVAGLAMLAAAGTLLATRNGPALSPDSVTYLSAARNILSGHGYTDFTGQAVTTFGPGFPALLAAGHWTGLSLFTTARLLNSASFLCIVVLTWSSYAGTSSRRSSSGVRPRSSRSPR